MPPPNADTVRAFFGSFLEQDRPAADRLVFERCFPTAGRFVAHELLQVVPTEGDDVLVLYEYELEGGQRHRNAEVITVRDGRIAETQVLFGGRYQVPSDGV